MCQTDPNLLLATGKWNSLIEMVTIGSEDLRAVSYPRQEGIKKGRPWD